MADSKLKTFAFILYGVLTFLLLCAVLVLIFKDDKTCSMTVHSRLGPSPQEALPDLEKAPSESFKKVAEVVTSPPASAAGESMDKPTVQFEGEYELYESENFNDFLSELNIGYFTRLAASTASSRYFVTKLPSGQWSLKTVSTFGTSEIVFNVGVPFKEDRLDGKTVDSTVTFNGNTWHQVQKSDGPTVTVDRTFSDDGVVVVSTVNNVSSTRKYRRV